MGSRLGLEADSVICLLSSQPADKIEHLEKKTAKLLPSVSSSREKRKKERNHRPVFNKRGQNTRECLFVAVVLIFMCVSAVCVQEDQKRAEVTGCCKPSGLEVKKPSSGPLEEQSRTSDSSLQHLSYFLFFKDT